MSNNFKEKYKDLKASFKEVSHELWDTLEDNRRIEKENYYLTQFVSFKGLWNEYEYFKEHAHEVDNPDNPFPPLIL